MTTPLVSICLPCLNATPFLKERMDTLVSQTLTDWEMIVCDSYSDDGSWELFQEYKNDERIKLYQVPRKGSYAGWNECLKRASGEYVYIATADDTCKPELLEKMVGALEGVQRSAFSIQRSEVMDAGDPGQDQRDRGRSVASGKSGEFEELGIRSQVSPATPATYGTSVTQPSTQNQEQITKNTELFPRSVDLAVCDFDFIDEQSNVMNPPPRGVAKTFYGEWLQKPHLRSGYLEFLVHLCVDVSWTTMTAVVFRRSLLDKTGLFVADAGPLGDRFFAMKSALNSDTVFVPGRLATWRVHQTQESARHETKIPRLYMNLVRDFLAVNQDLIPEEWRNDPEWIRKLLWGPRSFYLRSLGIDRRNLKSNLSFFLHGCCASAVQEPRFLLERLASGLAWHHRELGDEKEYLMKLIDEWDVPWPPIPL